MAGSEIGTNEDFFESIGGWRRDGEYLRAALADIVLAASVRVSVRVAGSIDPIVWAIKSALEAPAMRQSQPSSVGPTSIAVPASLPAPTTASVVSGGLPVST